MSRLKYQSGGLLTGTVAVNLHLTVSRTGHLEAKQSLTHSQEQKQILIPCLSCSQGPHQGWSELPSLEAGRLEVQCSLPGISLIWSPLRRKFHNWNLEKMCHFPQHFSSPVSLDYSWIIWIKASKQIITVPSPSGTNKTFIDASYQCFTQRNTILSLIFSWKISRVIDDDKSMNPNQWEVAAFR